MQFLLLSILIGSAVFAALKDYSLKESNRQTRIACEYFFGNVKEVAQDVAACELELRDVIRNYGKQPTPNVILESTDGRIKNL